jgi:hypothetical protein
MLQHYIKNSEGSPEIRPLIPQGQWLGFLAEEPDRERIAQYLPDHAGRVWLVMARNRGSPNRARVTDELQAALSTKYRDVQKLRGDGNRVGVRLYSNPIPGVFGGQWQESGNKIESSKYKCHKLPLTRAGTNGDD